MSNTSDTKPYIKISDSFDVPIQMIDTSIAGGGSLALTQQYSRVLLEYVGSNEWVMYR